MRMSKAGIETLIKPFEGCKLAAYICPAGKCTIGYGHTSAAGLPEVSLGMKITQKEADSILLSDLQKIEIQLYSIVHQPLTQNQFDVLVDFVFNAGIENLKTSTLLKKVNAADYDSVPSELMKWTKGNGKVLPGLIRRRQAEIEWWNAGASHVEQEQRIVPDAVVARTMAQSKQGNAALITASLGSIGAVHEAVSQAEEAADAASRILRLLHNPNFLIMASIISLGAAIWYWRSKSMEKSGD